MNTSSAAVPPGKARRVIAAALAETTTRLLQKAGGTTWRRVIGVDLDRVKLSLAREEAAARGVGNGDRRRVGC